MMDQVLPFPSGAWFLTLAVLLVARGLDMLSTWVATPNLTLEGNPIARLLGWRWGIPVNLGCCLVLAFMPFAAVVMSTVSVLVAARNFQLAWLMRSLGEQAYREWHTQRFQETPITLYLLCLAANTLLTASVGGAVAWFSRHALVPLGIGAGIIGYAVAVAGFTLLAIWRLRRATLREARWLEKHRFFSKDASRPAAAGLASLSRVAPSEGK
jgi:hypothetical protein